LRTSSALEVWLLCLYLMGLNLSNRQIAAELGLNKDDVQRMTEQLREGVEAKGELELTGEVSSTSFTSLVIKAMLKR